MVVACPSRRRRDSPARLKVVALDPAVVQRLLQLDPELSRPVTSPRSSRAVPAPRIILLQGSFAPVTMEPFAQFLIAMGYPEDRIRNPRDGAYSSSSFGDSRQLAGTLAWYLRE